MFRLLVFLTCLTNFQYSFGDDDLFQLPSSFTKGDSPDVSSTVEYNLLDGIKIPFQDIKTQYTEEADDGFVAFGFRNGSDVKMAHRIILPESLSEEFSILADLKPKNNRGGFIFAVVNSRENVVQFGVKLTNQDARTVIELFYTPAGVMTSQSLASFNVPSFTDRWTKFALRVATTKVTLFFNCSEAETLSVDRQPLKLTFESASTLYLAQAGPNLGEAFEGVFALLKIYGNPDVAAEQCRDYPDLSALGLPLVDDDPYLESYNVIPTEDYDVSNDVPLSVERTDYPPYRKEDGEWGGEFPPPPPPPDGKNACLCGLDCCNVLNDTQAAGRFRGPKGDRGMRGPPGESVRGPPGPPGPPGLPGVAPPEPTCSCNLSSIISSLQHSGGYSSISGKDGLPGLQGEPGRAGERGPTGPRGEKGERGERGPPGPPGPPGMRGELGKEGPPGPPGPPGEMGPPGPTEVDHMDDLRQGSPGNARPGIPGSKGEPGKNGTKGDKGPSGPRGPPGPKGDRGDRGLPGPKGTPGVDGFPGTPGLKGESGTPGIPGTPGVVTSNGNTTILECPPGPPGVKGAVGGKGEPGEKGDKGVGSKGGPGEKGAAGLDGAIGPVGPPGSKGERGERGPPGEIFLQKGEDGERKLLTLKGEKGDMGRRGRRGKIGPQGPPGPPGKLLDSGLGRPGLPGIKGDKGDPWSGPFPKGEKGEAGTPGKDSESRFIPVPGPPGPPGPPGLPGLSITGPKGEPGETFMSEPLFNIRPEGQPTLEELRVVEELQRLKGRSTDTPPIAHAVTQKKETPPMGGAMAFRSRSIMLEATKGSPIGTMVYIIEEESLLLRVGAGWQYVALGALLHTETGQQTTAEPPQVNPPFESSNLVHHLPEEVPQKPPEEGNRIEEAKTTQFAALRLAALNDPYPGNSGGIRGADYDCYREAHRAGIRGTFRAFLASRGQDVSSIVRQVDRVLPVTNLRGEVLFDSWMQIFDGKGAQFAHQPRIFSFNGKNIMTDPYWPEKSIWHGATMEGTRALDTSCEGWHSNHPSHFGLAGNLKGQMLIDQNKVSCDRKLILLCIEATSEIFVQRRRRDLRHNKLLTEEQYQDFLSQNH